MQLVIKQIIHDIGISNENIALIQREWVEQLKKIWKVHGIPPPASRVLYGVRIYCILHFNYDFLLHSLNCLCLK